MAPKSFILFLLVLPIGPVRRPLGDLQSAPAWCHIRVPIPYSLLLVSPSCVFNCITGRPALQPPGFPGLKSQICEWEHPSCSYEDFLIILFLIQYLFCAFWSCKLLWSSTPPCCSFFFVKLEPRKSGEAGTRSPARSFIAALRIFGI